MIRQFIDALVVTFVVAVAVLALMLQEEFFELRSLSSKHQDELSKVNQQLTGLTRELEEEKTKTLDLMKNLGIARLTIAFHAKLSSTVNVPRGTILKFAQVITNNGNAYSPDTGKFVAPRDGTYRFEWSYLVLSGYQSHVCGTVNGKIIQNTAIKNLVYFHMASGFMIVQLKKKDEVYLQACSDNAYLYADLSSNGFSFFGGHMI